MSSKAVIGEQEFEIGALSIKRTREWREKYGQQLIDAFGLFSQAEKIELTDASSVMGLMSSFGAFVLNMPDLVVDAVLDYVPAMADERCYIEENATYDDLGAILLQVLKVAYPFGSLASNAMKLAGAAQRGTSKS